MGKADKYIIIAILIIAIGSCKSRQVTVTPKNTSTPKVNLSTKEIIKNVNRASGEIKYIDIINAEAILNQHNRDFSIRIRIKVIKDEEISISVLPILGIELYRVKLTPERYFVFDKLKGQYCDGSYQSLSEMTQLQVTYKDIEAMLLNKLFTVSNEKNIEKAFLSVQHTDKFILTSKEKTQGYNHIFEISPDYMVYSTYLKENGKDAIKVDYTMFNLIDKVLFPTMVEMKTDLPKNNFALKIKIKKISINKPFDIDPIVLKKYNRVDCKKIF